MKFYKKLILVFLLTLLIGCVLGSLLKPPLDTLVGENGRFANLVDYKEGVYNYGKIMRRTFLAVAIIILILLRKPLGLIQLSINGLRFKQGWARHLLTGLIIGIGSLIIYGISTYFLGVQSADLDQPLKKLILKPFIYLTEACLIAAFEETLFRGFILRGLMKDFSISVSAVLVSLFYATLHLFSFKAAVSPGSQPFVGFNILARFFDPLFFDLNSTLPYLIGLFIVGIVLSVASLQTNSLYLPIGLHAGWVSGIKLNKLFLDHNPASSILFFGNGHIISGIFGWLFLLFVLVIIRQVKISNDPLTN